MPKLCMREAPRCFPKPEHFHFCQAAFERPPKGGVRLDSIYEKGMVGFRGGYSLEEGWPIRYASDLYHVHGSSNVRADCLGGDAEMGQNLQLAVGGGATMASHSGNYEWFELSPFEGVDDRLYYLHQIPDPTTPNCHCNGVSRRHSIQDTALLQGEASSNGRVGDSWSVEPMADFQERRRQGSGKIQVSDLFEQPHFMRILRSSCI